MYDMFKIKEGNNKYVRTCGRCTEKGYVDLKCTACGGKGVRFSTTSLWTIEKVEIVKINRLKSGVLAFWVDNSTLYTEDAKLLHFTYEDAQRECDKRNSIFSKISNLEVIKERKK